MDNFPDEILLMIFQYMPSRDIFGCVRHVCSRWAALAEHNTLCVKQLQDVNRMSRGTRSVRVLTLIIPLRQFLFITSKAAPYLRELTIYAGTLLMTEHLKSLSYLVCLEHLDIFLLDQEFSHKALPVLLKMKSLVINENISSRVLYRLAATKRLQAFYMYGRSRHYIRNELLVLLRARQHHLRELVLRCNELHDEWYDAIGQCARLTSLQLYSCWLMTGTGIQSTTRPRHLRRLHITGTPMVRTQALSTFLEHIPQSVEELVLSKGCFGDEHIAPLIHRLPALQVLELWKCRLTAGGAVSLAEALPSLRFLDLDITITKSQIRNLDSHPSLLFVRCLTELNNPSLSVVVQSKNDSKNLITNNINVISTDERYPLNYFRNCGEREGYRGSLYYYWTQDFSLSQITSTDTDIDLDSEY